MAPRSIWKGSLGFGMVAIPVKLFSGTEEKAIHFNQIHRECGGRIQMPKFCPTCDRKVEGDELVKGYEVGKGQYVLLEESDFTALAVKSLKNIELVEFVDASAIDPRQTEKSYFLAPDEAGPKAFSLLLQAMAKVGKVGVARLSIREREHLCAVRPFGKVLILQTLYWAEELRDAKEVEVALPAISEKELEMALMLLGTLVNDKPDLSQYRDKYRDAVMAVIQAKLNGETITAAPEAPKPAMDLVDALMASIQANQKGKVAA